MVCGKSESLWGKPHMSLTGAESLLYGRNVVIFNWVQNKETLHWERIKNTYMFWAVRENTKRTVIKGLNLLLHTLHLINLYDSLFCQKGNKLNTEMANSNESIPSKDEGCESYFHKTAPVIWLFSAVRKPQFPLETQVKLLLSVIPKVGLWQSQCTFGV